MRLHPSRIPVPAMLAAAVLAAAAAAGWRVFRAEAVRAHMDFASPASLRELTWKCHTDFALGRDSGRPYLETVTYEGTPGLELPWLNGDWRPYRRVCILGTLPDGDSARFRLSVWDGQGAYETGNRLRLDLELNGAWRNRCVEIGEGDGRAHTPSGRRFDLSRVRRVVLFTQAAPRPFRFRLATVDLEP